MLVTGMPLPDQFIDNVLASPQGALTSEKFERFEAVFVGAGDTLSAALAALLATRHRPARRRRRGARLPRPASTRASAPAWATCVPDRLFWALPAGEDEARRRRRRRRRGRQRRCRVRDMSTDADGADH